MKSVKFERLFERFLASSALSLGLLLAGHPVLADETAKPQTEVAVPLPDYPQAIDVAPDANTAAPAAEPAKAAAPAAEPAKAAAPAVGPAKAAAPAPTVTADANSVLADKLRDIVTGKQLDRLVSRRAEREGVEQFYKARDYKPLWVSDGAADDRAKAAIAYLAQVDSVGLDPNDYPVSEFRRRRDARRARRSRDQVHQFGAHLCEAGRDRPHPFQPRRRRHPVRSGGAGAGQGAGQARRSERRRCSARQLQSAAARVQGAAGKARRIAQGARGQA